MGQRQLAQHNEALSSMVNAMLDFFRFMDEDDLEEIQQDEEGQRGESMWLIKDGLQIDSSPGMFNIEVEVQLHIRPEAEIEELVGQF